MIFLLEVLSNCRREKKFALQLGSTTRAFIPAKALAEKVW